MKETRVPSGKVKIEGFPYQLIKWQKTKKDLKVFIEPFRRHNEESAGIIVKSPAGWAIFTKGGRS